MIWAALIGLASYRVWRLLAEDSITEAAREWLLSRSPDWLEEMVRCPWCLGSHIAFAVTWGTDAAIGIEAPVLVGLGAAVVVGWLGENL